MTKKIDNIIWEEVKNAFIENFNLTFKLALSLFSSSKKTKKLFPITEDKLENLSETEFANIELLISRFSKLQDMLGSKIFRAVIVLDFEDPGSMRDIMNQMEKKYIIDSVEDWALLRTTRNNIIHEYVPRGEKAAETLNNVNKLAPELLKILINVHQYAEKQFKLDLSQFDLKKLKFKK